MALPGCPFAWSRPRYVLKSAVWLLTLVLLFHLGRLSEFGWWAEWIRTPFHWILPILPDVYLMRQNLYLCFVIWVSWRNVCLPGFSLLLVSGRTTCPLCTVSSRTTSSFSLDWVDGNWSVRSHLQSYWSLLGWLSTPPAALQVEVLLDVQIVTSAGDQIALERAKGACTFCEADAWSTK